MPYNYKYFSLITVEKILYIRIKFNKYEKGFDNIDFAHNHITNELR